MLKSGQSVPNFILPTLDASDFTLADISGKPYLLAFFRFASCPFCNIRLHKLIKRMNELPEGFTIVAVFESSIDELQRYAEKHEAPFPILADAGGVVHDQFDITTSWLGVLKGMLFRLPTLLYAMLFKGYIPLTIGGRMNTMPADFLIDSEGTIQEAYYGKDEGDHLDFEKIKEFAKIHTQSNLTN